MSLRRQILSRIGSAIVEGDEGRSRSFEVKLNNVLVFSKLKTRVFPDIDEVRKVVGVISNRVDL